MGWDTVYPVDDPKAKKKQESVFYQMTKGCTITYHVDQIAAGTVYRQE